MNSADAAQADWRDALLAGASALTGSDTLRCAVGRIGTDHAVIAASDFSSHGGSFGADDADAFVAAVANAIDQRLPLVTLLRSGGTRLPEGMHALVGIPRTTLALQQLRAAGLPHLSVAEHPTMGGVWVSIGSRADIRLAVPGALVGFSGPRAVAAMTGRDLADGANTALAAYDAGLVDALVEPSDLTAALGRVLAALRPDDPAPVSHSPAVSLPERDGWGQVVESRTADRPCGRQLADALLAEPIPLRGGDESVYAALGRLQGRRAVVAALAAERSTMPTPAGFDLLRRAADLADGLDLGLVCLVDTPGADPHLEDRGLSAAIATAMAAVLAVRSPTICLVHGEGGSGGALAGAVADVVGVGQHGWFAALGPEGAAATLRITPEAAANLMRVTPADLLENGFADEVVPAGREAGWLAGHLDALRTQGTDQRIQRRRERWATGLTRQP